MDEEHDWGQSSTVMLAALEYGSCDNCGNHRYCPICGASKQHTLGHNDGCPVPKWMKKLRG